MRKKLLSILALLCLTVSGAWAQNPDWLKAGDTWDPTTKTLTVNSNIEDWDGYVSNEIVHVIIANGVTSIGGGAFYMCEGLTSVTIGSGVTSIGEFAFYLCDGLTSVTIGSGVTSIGDGAFAECTDLTSVTIYAANAPSLGDEVFYNCPDFTTYVFSDCTGNYDGWPNVTAVPALTANPDGAGNNWATYYNELANVQMPSGTQVFKVALEGTGITMTEITDRIVNAGQGVVLKSSSASITLASAASVSETSYSGNSLKGTMTSITNPGNAFVLNNPDGGNGVGFYRLTADGTIGANKAYLTYSGALAREFFLFDEATGINSATLTNSEKVNNEVYDLQGRRVAQPTKGLYIVNGKKVIK